MKKVSIVYFSNTGVTESLILAAAKVFESNGIDVYTYQINGSEIVGGRFRDTEVFGHLHDSDAILFASPTYMGGVAAQFKAFADATSEFWSQQLWAGKYASGITCGSAPNGDQTVSLQYLCTLSSQHGMLWVGLDVAYSNSENTLNPLGCQLGVTAYSVDGEVRNADIETVKCLAERVSKLVKKYNKCINWTPFPSLGFCA